MWSSISVRAALLAMAMASFAFTALAQATAAERELRDKQLREQRLGMGNPVRRSDELPAWARPTSSRPTTPIPKRKMSAEHKLRLYPSAGERERFAAFLRQPRTGLVRLLQSGDCEDNPRVIQTGSCWDAVPPVAGGGTFYSFTHSSHELRQLSDLWLEGDVFRAGFAGSVLGLMTMLGDVPLEAVGPESVGVKYLAELVPPRSLAEARTQYRRNNAGFRVLGNKYGVAVPVRLDTTYLLRSTTYKFGDELDKQRKLDDVLIAFRVVGTTFDGNVTLLWKEMRRQKTPKIKKKE